MTRRLALFAAALSLAGTVGAAPNSATAGPAPTAQMLESKSKLCTGPIADAERRHRIPGQLMTAVAVAETGRWSEAHGAAFAWPWTVTSGVRSWRFTTKDAAVAHVHELAAQGITNIDVGCMQVNLGWHGDAFASIEDAFDPRANVAYAARLLTRHFEARRSWSLAVGFYHSATPELQLRYKRKVLKLWNVERRRAAKARREAVIARYEERRRERLQAQNAQR